MKKRIKINNISDFKALGLECEELEELWEALDILERLIISYFKRNKNIELIFKDKKTELIFNDFIGSSAYIIDNLM